MERVSTIDLFAGAGGLSIGASLAGARVRLEVDLDGPSCQTLRSNPAFINGKVLQADVSELTGQDLRSEAGLHTKEPLLIIGGAPCQAFSKAAYWLEDGDEARYRRARIRGRLADRPVQAPRAPDARRDLVGEFWRLVLEARADGFVFENVPSILHPRNRRYLERLRASAEGAGYQCSLVLANGVEHGVPQLRQRVFLLASKRSRPIPPEPTHTRDATRRPDLRPVMTAGDALRDVTPYAPVEPEEVVRGRWSGHLLSIPPGGNYKFHTAWAGHPDPAFVAETRFWSFLLKLSPDLPAWTIAASPGPWVGPFHWESRRLRTAELAALQTFPPDYEFSGNRRARVRQIGNAVPPVMATRMVGAVLEACVGASQLVA